MRFFTASGWDSLTNGWARSTEGMSGLLTLGQRGLEGFFFRHDSADDVHAPPVDSLFMLIFWISTFFFVVLMALMVLFVVKYRRRPGVPAPVSASHNTILELAWTIIPLAILAVFFFKGFWGYMDRAVAPGQSIELNLEASKWVWAVTYPNGESTPETVHLGASDIPVFYVPAETPVMMKMSSKDVMHSFWVPDFRGKFDVFPNRYTNYWFRANQPPPGAQTLEYKDKSGRYPYEDHWVFCAEYCGDKHSEMAAIIRVVPYAAYRKVVYDEWAGAKPPVEVGKIIFKTKCASCHTVDGSKNIGPTWKDMYGHAVQFNDGSGLSEEQMTGAGFDNYVRESIIAPAAKVVAGYPNQMTSFAGMSEVQINGIIAYIKSISDKAPKEEAAPAEGSPASSTSTPPATPSPTASQTPPGQPASQTQPTPKTEPAQPAEPRH